ncbi:hypothetical protein P3L10_015827 [Capsicum annuum]
MTEVVTSPSFFCSLIIVFTYGMTPNWCYHNFFSFTSNSWIQWADVSIRKVADPKKKIVGGHSYRAFMTENLLAHAPHFFCCGIARSGAYNRTLTPFGFQVIDHIINSAAKSNYLSAGQISVPFFFRGPNGALAGPTFSVDSCSWITLLFS